MTSGDARFESDRGTPSDGLPDSARAPRLAAQTMIFGRYRILRELGRGGMGVVYLARDEELGIDVAIKLLPDLVFQDDESLGELKREVLRGIALTHPGLVRTFEFVRDATMAGIVMEYVDGGTFALLKRQQPGGCFDAEDLLPWLEQLCQILDFAHFEARIAHRDLKPRNLMFTSAGYLKVADFGISSTLVESVSRVSVQTHTSGTPAYMSPQQVMGGRPSHLDDIYSLGATIYELLTGKPPFHRGQVVAQVMDAVAPSMAERRIELEVEGKNPIPAAWERTVAACLAKDPAGRPQSAGDMLAMLTGDEAAPLPASVEAAVATQVVRSKGTPVPRPSLPVPVGLAADAPPASAPAQRKSVVLLGALAVAVVALLALGLWFKGSRNRQPAEWVPPAPPSEAGNAPSTEVPNATPGKRSPLPALAAAKAEDLASAKPGSLLGLDLGSGQQMAFCRIPAGKFMMCSPSTDPDRKSDEAQHEVTLTQPFWLARTEVTQAHWEAVMGRNPSHFKGKDLPVEQVSWLDAAEFCRKVNERERAARTLPDGWEFALPTEAQWEYACRAGRDAEGKDTDESGWHGGNSGDTTHPAGVKTANEWGLHDMRGNVSEWCADWHGEYPSDGTTNPAGPATGVYRVNRGGSWDSDAAAYRAAARRCNEPGYSDRTLGFRPALVPSPPTAQPVKTPQPPVPPAAKVFSRTLAANFFAVEADTLAKTPDATLADPVRLLEFLSGAPKGGKIHKLVSAQIPIQDGVGKLEEIKPWIYATGFKWQGDTVVPDGEESRNVGWSVEVRSTTEVAGMVKLDHNFRWVRKLEIRPIHGVTKEIGFPDFGSIRYNSSISLPVGKTVLVAEWQSETPPPDAKAGGSWQYLLFYTLR